MPNLDDLEIDIYDKDFGFLAAHRNPLDATEFVPKFNAAGTSTLIVDPASDVADILNNTDGVRLIARYRDEHLLSGMIRSDQGPITPNGQLTFTVEDDYRILNNTAAWVAPANPVTPAALDQLGQAWQTGAAGTAGTTTGQSGYFVWPDGVDTAEAAIKHIITVNLVTRLGRPVTVLPNQDRGGDARAAGILTNLTPRNGTLADEVAPILEWSGLGLRVWQEPRGNGYLIDVFEPQTWPSALDHTSGALAGGGYERHRPTATRILAGGPGEGPDRAFATLADAALEDRYNDVIEIFAEATGATLEWPESLAEAFRVPKYFTLRPEVADNLKTRFTNYLTAAARKKLDENAATASITAALAETDAFHMYGEDGLRPGDLIPIVTRVGTLSERITSATLTLSDGLTITPTLGKTTNEDDGDIWEAIATIAAGISRMSRST